MAYLITCSGSKYNPDFINPGSPEQLSFHGTLHMARENMMQLTGINVNWNFTLPAWKLYSGHKSRLYRRVDEENWTKPCTQIKILSALFGWIRHTDLIPFYDLRMNDCYQNRSIWSYWYDMNVLEGIVDAEDIDLLFRFYRRAIHGNTNPVANLPDRTFRGYGDQHGVWLNEQLMELGC